MENSQKVQSAPVAINSNFVLMAKKKFIDVENLIASKSPKTLKRTPGFVIRYLKRILHQEEINAFIDKHGDKYGVDFCDEIISYFNIKCDVRNIERIPKHGKVVLVMNHPLGGMDALVLISALRGHREDLKFIVNDLLMNLENLKDLFVGVDKHARAGISLKEQIDNLFLSDQSVCIFPAGMVSRYYEGKIQDFEWKKTFVKYARTYGHDIVPIYIDGKLSKFFYRLYRLRKFLRIKTNIEMLYLSDELFKQRNKTLTFVVGEPIPNAEILQYKNDLEASKAIREKTYALKNEL